MNEQPFSSDPAAPRPSVPRPAPIAPPAATPPQPLAPAAPAQVSPAEVSPASDEALQRALRVRGSGAGWFYWIAGLSIVNSVIVLSGGDTSFPLGLGSTLFIDVGARELAKQGSGAVAHAVALVLDFLIIGFFILCGLKAGKGASWAFVVGGILYALDLLIMLAFREWLGVGLHAWALFSLFAGYKANQTVRKLQTTTATSPWSG